ncbi:RNA pol II accessory factor, Cdc73 family-domain-containing protein [Geopyxis carbonaria]|nr:RNA pol II accessory factor, Cdc73 family-domain-containing protein [Geopyxis carbonaria]
MATPPPDSILLLKASIAAGLDPTLSPTDDFSTATHLNFAPLPPLTTTPTSIALTTPTRFTQGSKPVDLRSLYFAWTERNTPITGYISASTAHGILNLGFVERLELVTHLEGGQEDSVHITPLPASASASSTTPTGASGKPALAGKVRVTDPRLLEIYSYERVITNRNTLLRGIKPTDFSHVRKQAEDFITRLRAAAPGAPGTKSLPTRPGMPPKPAAPPAGKKQRPRDPIILLSPSASSLLTMGNIKPFLETGVFAPPQLNAGHAPQLLHVSRALPAISPSPLRFVIVDSPDKFKPEYWDRVVAVFTTGQEWQFRGYRWDKPVELFRQVKGFYVGWDGEPVPDAVKRWGGGVTCFSVDRGRRFRDREVCEKFWEGVERWMRVKGTWNR